MMKALSSLLLVFLMAWQTGNTQSASERFPENPSLDFKIGQMLNVGFRGMQANDSPHIIRDLEEYYIGGVVLFDYDVPSGRAVRNIESPNQLRNLVSELKGYSTPPLFVTIDQEGGRVSRLKTVYGFPASVSSQYLGSIDDSDTTSYYAIRTAQTLADMGINVNLAPVVDVNLNPDNPVIGAIERSFSPDPGNVARYARTFIESHHNHSVLTTLKHFPGHGSSEQDSHIGLTDVTRVWSESELIPYRELIESGDVDMIMTAHIYNEAWDTEYPATLSHPVITGMLREQLGFDGVVISDDMQMEAIRSYYGLETAIKQAILAGVDILCFANNSVYDEDIIPKAHAIIKQLVEEDEIPEERIEESYRRIVLMKESL